MRQIITFILLITALFNAVAQELPPTIRYAPDDYGADNQNWMISQSSKGFIYVANNRGLLEFDGARWAVYQSPNNTILRAVKVLGNRIYTGCFSEFGYWTKDERGLLNYTSLVDILETQLKDQQIWDIVDYNDFVVFQSSKALYFYNANSDEISVINSDHIIYKIFIVDNQIYYHVAEEGLYKLEQGEPKLEISEELFFNDRIIDMVESREGLLMITRKNKFFSYSNGKLNTWNNERTSYLQGKTIFSALHLRSGGFILGTISNGLIHLDKEGNLQYQMTQKQGLGNNTVLSLFEDSDQNVWAGLDNGVNCINQISPITKYSDLEGVLGTVYASIVHGNHLYLGTNQGLFVKPLYRHVAHFEFISGTAGQVLNLYNYQGNLFCGHHLGTFLVDGDQVEKISDHLGAWKFEPIPGDEDLLLQGNYSGLYVLSKKSGIWSVRNKIEGYDNSSRYFEFLNSNEILVSHEYKGVFSLRVSEGFGKVLKLTEVKELPISKNSSLTTYKGNVLYAAHNGIYRYSSTLNRFEKDSILSEVLKFDTYVSGKMETDEDGRLWVFTKNNINLVTTDHVSNNPIINRIALPDYLRNGALGYENIEMIDDHRILMGTSDGYLFLDMDRMYTTETDKLYLNTIRLEKTNGTSVRLTDSDPVEIEYKEGSIVFEYSVPNYDRYKEINYRYRLVGLKNDWGRWQTDTSAKFENLPFGDYKFELQSKVGNQMLDTNQVFEFKILRPWYLSDLLIVVYGLLFLLILIGTHKISKRYYQKRMEHEQLENQQVIMKINNEKLNQEIENKNRELAISTMSIIKKNEVLNKIKKELKNSTKMNDDHSAIKLIDNSLNNNKDWKFFKQAFNNADKDFLDKIKTAHPELTPNDLRFCAYLRLNLSSKEIAPLLNISTKSVETKRYRLRKRLKLQHNQSLVNYILKF